MTDDEPTSLKEIWKEFPNYINEYCKEKGISPEKDLGIDMNAKARGQTVWDINEEPEKKFFKFKATIQCSQCKKDVTGDLILDRKELSIRDTLGFMILQDPVCDNCLEK